MISLTTEKQMSADEYNSFLDDLAEGTKFKRVSEARMMHDRPKVRTPLWHMNAILGGGFPLGAMVELYGEPSSGKSSFSYQVIGEFQKQYPQGLAVVVDVESSVDSTRMEYLGCNPENVLRLPADTMQSGFEQVHSMLKKKVKKKQTKNLPVLVVYDTISISPTDAQYDKSDIHAGGMMEQAKLIKGNLSNLLPLIEEQPILFLLLNQITTKKTRYGSSITSGGGYGLKHDIHMKLKFLQNDTEFLGEFAIKAKNAIEIDKSKLCPLSKEMNFVMDIRKGGVIDELESAIEYCIAEDRNIISKTSNGWYSFLENPSFLDMSYEDLFGKEVVDKYIFFKNKRFDPFLEALQEDIEVYSIILTCLMMERFSSVYEYQKEVISSYKEVLLEQLHEIIDTKSGESEEDETE